LKALSQFLALAKEGAKAENKNGLKETVRLFGPDSEIDLNQLKWGPSILNATQTPGRS